MSDDRIVAVTGATGRQGGAVARHLLAGGWRVRAITRKPQSGPALQLAALGAHVVTADMAHRDELAQAFRDAYGVFSMQNPMISGLDGEVAQGRNVAEAAKEIGIEHVVYSSAAVGVAGSGVGLWESKLAVEAHMKALGLPLTVLRPVAFMELMTDKDFYPPVSTWHLMPKLMGAERPVPWIAVDDLGAIAARAFGDPDRFIGRDLRPVADLQSIEGCRQIWYDATGRLPRRFPMPVWIFERFDGTGLTMMWRWLRTGNIEVDLAETREIMPTALTVREWLIRRYPSV
jgi:uncharacterized protein YbjT (DUF2867 family)